MKYFNKLSDFSVSVVTSFDLNLIGKTPISSDISSISSDGISDNFFEDESFHINLQAL